MRSRLGAGRVQGERAQGGGVARARWCAYALVEPMQTGGGLECVEAVAVLQEEVGLRMVHKVVEQQRSGVLPHRARPMCGMCSLGGGIVVVVFAVRLTGWTWVRAIGLCELGDAQQRDEVEHDAPSSITLSAAKR